MARCRLAGLTLTAEGDQLHVDSVGEPPIKLIEELRAAKPEILALLHKADHVPLEQLVLDRRVRYPWWSLRVLAASCRARDAEVLRILVAARCEETIAAFRNAGDTGLTPEQMGRLRLDMAVVNALVQEGTLEDIEGNSPHSVGIAGCVRFNGPHRCG